MTLPESTTKYLSEVKEREQAAGKERWFQDSHGNVVYQDADDPETEFCIVECLGPNSKIDNEFIAHAKQDIPRLLQIIDVLGRENAELRSGIEAVYREQYDSMYVKHCVIGAADKIRAELEE